MADMKHDPRCELSGRRCTCGAETMTCTPTPAVTDAARGWWPAWWAFVPWNLNRPAIEWTCSDQIYRHKHGADAEYVAILSAQAAAAAGVEPPR